MIVSLFLKIALSVYCLGLLAYILIFIYIGLQKLAIVLKNRKEIK